MPSASSTPVSSLSGFAGRRVLLCVGPGGVGKTTCAAALALTAAEAGRRVCVVTIDPSQRLAQALGLDARAIDGRVVPVLEGSDAVLDALLLDSSRVFDEIVRVCAKDGEAANAILVNPIYQATAQRLGGALEYAAMARLQMLHADDHYDLVVLDTPPTANAIQFLEAPGRIRELVDNPAAKLLTGATKIGGKILGLGTGVLMNTLERIGGGTFIGDLGAFLRDFASVIAEFHRRAGDVDALLQSQETGVVLTTSATAFSVREATAFIDTLLDRGLHVDGVLLNRYDSPLPAVSDLEPLRAHVGARTGETGSDLDRTMERVAEIYGQARAQGAGAHVAHEALTRRYPSLPVWIAKRRDPPPEDLAALRGLGQELFGAARAR
jgi:anion-transporting  ArsA/GET3 family ATPase